MQSMKSLGKQHIFYVESKLFQTGESIEGLRKAGTPLLSERTLGRVCFEHLDKVDFEIKAQLKKNQT